MLQLQIASAQESTDEKPSTDAVSASRLPTGRLLTPAGISTELYGRPNDLALSLDGKLLFVKDWKALRVLDAKSMKLLQTVDSPGNSSLTGIVAAADGRVLMSNAKASVHVFSNDAKAKSQPSYRLQRSIDLPKESFPCGIELSADEKFLYVCLSKKNTLAIVSIETGELVKNEAVGVAPFDVAVQGGRIFVSNIGGRLSTEADRTAPSAETKVVVDKRGIASTGTVSVIDASSHELVDTIDVGRHPSSIGTLGEQVFVCNTNEDAVSLIDVADFSVVNLNVKPSKRLPFGSMPNGAVSSPDGKYFFVALAGNNAVAVFQHNADASPALLGLIPTGWYPVNVCCNEDNLFIANIKGVGARSIRRDEAKGRNSHDHRGTVQQVSLAQVADADQLKKWTDTVFENGHFPQILRSMASPNAGSATAIPVPEKLGQPSTIKHVIYVIKENRTFDQVFGDVKEARSEPSLCVFPEEITPNHHALAKRFGLLDNYYCNGVLSADGHSWATEGNVTPYLERAFGGFARSYTFGDDPITYSSSGFLWDRFLDAGLSFRNYGEFNYSKPPAGFKYQEVYRAWKAGEPIKFEHNIGVERVRNYSCPDYPGWNMLIPDGLRMDRFMKEFREFEAKGNLPNLTLIYLPQDHLGGGVTGRAHMADNDLAIGRLVEAVSNSKFWPETAIFINEDDPQNGFDHIDGHRSLCLVVSPFSKSGVNHSFYNQTSVLRTMLHMFGLPPLNQQDASMPLMRDCFTVKASNAEPYKAIPVSVELNEVAKPKSDQSSLEKKWRRILATVPIERTGMKTEKDEANLNRFIWHEAKGWETPFPNEFSGAHGKGLKKLGLTIDSSAIED
jgi:DNA-binding beta-propeller fold protein YncE